MGLDKNDRYWVVQCPYCSHLSVYENLYIKKKNYRKRCPYCNKTFTIVKKNSPSSEIVKFTHNDYEYIKEFLKRYKLLYKR